jgi:hypothetical protein
LPTKWLQDPDEDPDLGKSRSTELRNTGKISHDLDLLTANEINKKETKKNKIFANFSNGLGLESRYDKAKRSRIKQIQIHSAAYKAGGRRQEINVGR